MSGGFARCVIAIRPARPAATAGASRRLPELRAVTERIDWLEPTKVVKRKAAGHALSAQGCPEGSLVRPSGKACWLRHAWDSGLAPLQRSPATCVNRPGAFSPVLASLGKRDEKTKGRSKETPFAVVVQSRQSCRRFPRPPGWAVRTRGPERSCGTVGAGLPDWAGRVDGVAGS